MKSLDLQEIMTEILTLAVFGLTIFQLISYIVSAVFPSVRLIKLGLGFMILSISGAILGAILIVRQTSIGKLDKSVINYIILATVFLVLVLFFMPELLPEIFDKQTIIQEMSVVMSTIGFGG